MWGRRRWGWTFGVCWFWRGWGLVSEDRALWCGGPDLRVDVVFQAGLAVIGRQAACGPERCRLGGGVFA